MIALPDISARVEEYHSWLRQKTSLTVLENGWAEITTPFLNRHNDHVQIFVRKDGLGYELNDDGETIRDLQNSGCRLDTPKRKEMLEVTLNGFGVHLNDDRICARSDLQSFPRKKHNLIQAITTVNDLFFTSSPHIVSFFKEDVLLWLQSADVRFLADVEFTGKSGFLHKFDFAVPSSRAAPDRLIRTVNRPTKDAALGFIVAWNDTYEQRRQATKALAILNDNEQTVPSAVIEALNQYSIDTILWSERTAMKDKLAA